MNHEPIALSVEITIDQPIAYVWEIWTSPVDIMQWNIPFDNWHSPRVVNDVRPGGQFSYRMEAKDGSEGFEHSGTYENIIKNKLITYTLLDGRTSMITFTSKGDTTTIVETFEPEKELSYPMQRDFCFLVLKRFKTYTESKGNSSK